MAVMSIRIDDEKRKKLKAIASIEGKTMSSIMEGLIDEYINRFYRESDHAEDLKAITKVSETSFDEWDNDEDRVYDDM